MAGEGCLEGAPSPPWILIGINPIFQFFCWIKFMKCSALWVINVLIVTIASFQFPINMIGIECAQTARSGYFASCSSVAESAEISATPPLSGLFPAHTPFRVVNNSSILVPSTWGRRERGELDLKSADATCNFFKENPLSTSNFL